jgi:hypothetical protein
LPSRARSVVVDAALAAALALGAAGLPLLPAVAKATLAVVLFAALSRLAYVLATRLLPAVDRATSLVATLVVLVAGWTVLGTVLGHLGSLTPRAVLAASALLAGASARFAARPTALGAEEPEAPPSVERAAVLGVLAFFVASTLLAVFVERNDPPGAQGYDDTSYHLSAAATWWNAHDLRTIKFPVGDPGTTFYPFVGELFSFLLLVPFDGLDVLARWSEVPFALGCLASLASLARLLGLSREGAGLAVLLYAASPRAFPLGMLGAGNDHAVAFFVLASACGAVLLRRGPDAGRAAFLGASLGLLAGTKYTGALFLPPLVLLAVASLAAGVAEAAGSSTRVAAAGRACLTALAVALAVGGYTYARNATATGNPFFPATVSFFGRRILRGLSGDTLSGFGVSGASGFEPLRFLWERTDLLGPLFRWMVLPAAILAPLVALGAWTRPRRRGDVLLFLLPAVLFMTFARFMVDHRDVRYVYGGLAVACLSFPWLLERLPPRAARCGLLAALLAVGYALLVRTVATGGWGRAGAAAVPAFVTAILVARRTPGARLTRAPRRVAVAAGSVFAWIALAAWSETYAERRLDALPAARFLAKAAPSGSTVAFCGGNQPYLFFGRKLENRVLYVPTYAGPPAAARLAPPLGASFFTWDGPLSFPRERASRAEWRENLRRLGAAFVVVVRAGEDLPERDWIAADPESFSRIYRDPRYEIFAVREAPPAADRFRIGFDRAESDYFLEGAWRRDPRGGVGAALPEPRLAVMVPPLDAPATAIELEGEALADAAVVVNGGAAEPIERRDGRAAFRVPPGSWRPGRNRISVAPAPGSERTFRLSALALALDAARPITRRGSGDLPGNLDAPAEGSVVRGGSLRVSGWCRERGGGSIDAARFSVDGRAAAVLRSARVDRPGITSVLPYLVEEKDTGFEADLDVSGLTAGVHGLVVELETPDGRCRTLPVRRFVVER